MISNSNPLTSFSNLAFSSSSGDKSKNIANSVTGLSIAAGSSGIALAGYVGELIPISSNLWFFVFLAQCGLYGLIFVTAGRGKNKPQ